MLIAQFSDPHIMLPGKRRRLMGDTTAHLTRAVTYVNALRPQPAAVVVTGDLADGGRAEEYARLRDALKPLAMPVYVVPGNHDRCVPLRAVLHDHTYLGSGDGPVHYSVDHDPLRLVGFDSTRRGAAGGAATSESLKWLDATLRTAPDRATVLFMHHPPFRTGMLYMDALGFVGLAALRTVVARHSQVRLILSGHVHRDIVSECGGAPARTSRSTAPQVVPEVFERRALWVRFERPALTLHRWVEPPGRFESEPLTVSL